MERRSRILQNWRAILDSHLRVYGKWFVHGRHSVQFLLGGQCWKFRFSDAGLIDDVERRDDASSASIVDGFQDDADEERLEKWYPLHVERFAWPRHMPEEVYY